MIRLEGAERDINEHGNMALISAMFQAENLEFLGLKQQLLNVSAIR